MREYQSWTELIKNIPTWVKGALGFITLIIGFIILLRNNLYLGMTVIVVVMLITLLFLSIYAGFAKTKPLIYGGKGVYRYEKYRGWAVFGVFISLVLIVIIFLSEPTRYFIVIAFDGTPTPTATLTATPIPTPTATAMPIPRPTVTLRGSPLYVREAINIVEEANTDLKRVLLDMSNDWLKLKKYWCGPQAWDKMDNFVRNMKNDYGISVSAIYTPTDALVKGPEDKPSVEQTETWTYTSVEGHQKTETRFYTYGLRKTGDEKQSYCINTYLYSETLP